MRHFLAILFVAVPFLLIGEAGASGGRHDWDRLERQEGCERYCIDCVANGESPMCMGMYRMCCAYYGGQITPGCGCRVEL